MALTILEAAKLAANAGEYRKAGVLTSFAESSPILRRMPIMSIPGNAYSYARQAELPSVAFRAVNGAFTPSEGRVEVRVEPLKLIGGEVDVDRALVTQMGADVRSIHEQMKAVALGQAIGAKIITGSASASPLEFDGLVARYGGASPASVASTQIIANSGSLAALSMAKLDAAIDAVDATAGQRVIMMTQAMRRGIQVYLRNSSSIQVTRDDWGNQVTTYAGLPILELNENGNTPATQFSGSDFNSIFVCALGEGGLHMVQDSAGISVRDLGEIPTAPVFRTRVDWACGLVDAHIRCVSRLYNTNDAAAVGA